MSLRRRRRCGACSRANAVDVGVWHVQKSGGRGMIDSTVLFRSIRVRFGIFDTIKIQKKSDKLRKNYCRNKKKVGVTRDNELNEIVQYTLCEARVGRREMMMEMHARRRMCPWLRVCVMWLVARTSGVKCSRSARPNSRRPPPP